MPTSPKIAIHIPKAPVEFDGALIDLYEHWAQNVLIGLPEVERFHQQLIIYLKSGDPTYFVTGHAI